MEPLDDLPDLQLQVEGDRLLVSAPAPVSLEEEGGGPEALGISASELLAARRAVGKTGRLLSPDGQALGEFRISHLDPDLFLLCGQWLH